MKKSMLQKVLLWSALFLAVNVLCLPSLAQAAGADWPRRPVEVIAPFRAGGDTDYYARIYAKYLEKELSATFTVINVEGAGGVVGCQQVAVARPDGNKVLFMNTGAMYANKLVGTSDLDHNSYDVSAIGILDNTNVVVTGKNAGFADGKDFVAKAKAEPGKYGVATTIPGFSFFTVCKLQAAGQFTLNPVDYGGAAAMTAAIVGNQIPLAVNSYGVFKQYIDNGDIIPLMVMSEKRNPSFPHVPTVGELGFAGAAAERAYFFAFPKGTDPKILTKLSDAVGAIQKNPDFAADIKKAYSVEPFYRDTANSKQYLDGIWTDMAKYKDALTKK
ncbi:ABC transporter substrate-binding protein [Deltaproteobacteria bacterium]|nr:ABC transporter substrate-binding protein [Deltaproteobacteria bacterium]